MEIPTSADGTLRRAYRAAAYCCLVGLAALTIDLSVARARPELTSHGAHYHFLNGAEVFGDGKFVPVICLAIFFLQPTKRPYLPRVLGCAFGAGLAANVVKLFVARWRPRALDLDLTESVLSSFLGLRPWMEVREGVSFWDSSLQSFPSAHTATAFGFAVGLSWLYQRGRILFTFLAVMVAFQRIVTGAHFPSDTLVGAAVGCAVAAYCIDRRGLGPRFDAWEEDLRRVIDARSPRRSLAKS